jgi:hypothetical protein
VQGNFYLSGESMLDYHLPTCALNTGKDEFCTCSGIKGGAYRTPETLENIPRLPEFIKTIEHIKELHQRKNQDYATGSNPFSNFDFSDYVNLFALGCGCNRTHLPFINHITTKLARLFVLLGDGVTPKNESIDDSFDDLATYVILWKCRTIQQREKEDAPSL